MDPRLNFLRSPSPLKGDLPARHVFTHANKLHGQVRAQYWPAKQGVHRAPEHVTVFWPGNPGLPDYYIYFLRKLFDQLPDTHAIVSFSHVAGDTTIQAPDVPLDLWGQVDAKVELINTLKADLKSWALQSDNPSPKFAVCAHSVGTWMTCEVMKRTDVIDVAYLTFPTLGWIGKSYNGTIMWPLFHRPIRPLVPYASYLARYLLPFTSLPPPSRALVSSPTTLHHVLNLARSEMRDIQAPDEDWFKSQAQKGKGRGVYGVWSAGNLDGWVGKDGPLVRECLGEERAMTLEGVPHAFCLWEEYSEIVADVVGAWIMDKPFVPKKAGHEQHESVGDVLNM